jgi:hypothetical protein
MRAPASQSIDFVKSRSALALTTFAAGLLTARFLRGFRGRRPVRGRAGFVPGDLPYGDVPFTDPVRAQASGAVGQIRESIGEQARRVAEEAMAAHRQAQAGFRHLVTEHPLMLGGAALALGVAGTLLVPHGVES